MAMTGDKEVLRDLDKYLRFVQSEGMEMLGEEFFHAVTDAIQFVDAIDTTRMIQGVDHTASFVVDGGRSMFVGASIGNPTVFYDGFVEFPTRNRDGSVRAGRYFYKRGIEKAEVHDIMNIAANRSFVL